MALEDYRRKRNFARTKEPAGKKSLPRGHAIQRQFVIQKHAASHLHYDFRLELDGVLKSWAVPKGPHLDPTKKSLAVQVEDHPLEYASFEGTIPAGEYGGGTVMVWDRGTWATTDDPNKSLKKGKLTFTLQGEKLHGEWSLVRMHGKANQDQDAKQNWLLIKKEDDAAQPLSQGDILEQQPLSVVTGRDMDEIAASRKGKTVSTTSKKKGSVKASISSRSKTKRKVSASTNTIAEMDLQKVSQARRKSFPKTFSPQLATLSSQVPEGEDWLHEVKYDGYRLIAMIDGGQVKLITRGGNDWTDRFSLLAQELGKLPVSQAVLDGEVVVLNSDGISDFQRLQNWLKSGRSGSLAYFVFDLPYLNGYDLQQTPLEIRKQLLAEVLPKDHNKGIVRYGGHIVGQGATVVEQACQLKAEGIVSKRLDSPYQQRRSRDWLKIKCSRRQEFIIVGYTRPSGSRTGFGALLLAYYEADELIYCGRVGTGFTEASLKQLTGELKKRTAKKSPFKELPKQERSAEVTWVKPELVCEVQFTEWSDDGLLRHPSFQGLREDKPAREVKREDSLGQAVHASNRGKNSSASLTMTNGKQPTTKRAAAKTDPATNGAHNKNSVKQSAAEVAGVRLTHPDRVLYPDEGITKLDLATFYSEIAEWILPHIVDRPLTVVRCPDGQSQACFFQKHLTTPMPDEVSGVEIKEKSKTSTYMVVKDLPGIIALVQMGVLEFHPWPARADNVERPDRLIFDLDPGEGVDWKAVVDGTLEIHKLLDGLGLANFVRTSGGKGLHVVIPLSRRNTWDELKGFAQNLALAMEHQAPDRYVANMSKAKRHGRIFIDYLRNQRGATAVASYSTRARAGAPVATPLKWSEVTEKIAANQFDVSNLRSRLKRLKSDPWNGFFDVKQSLSKALLAAVKSDSR